MRNETPPDVIFLKDFVKAVRIFNQNNDDAPTTLPTITNLTLDPTAPTKGEKSVSTYSKMKHAPPLPNATMEPNAVPIATRKLRDSQFSTRKNALWMAHVFPARKIMDPSKVYPQPELRRRLITQP